MPALTYRFAPRPHQARTKHAVYEKTACFSSYPLHSAFAAFLLHPTKLGSPHSNLMRAPAIAHLIGALRTKKVHLNFAHRPHKINTLVLGLVSRLHTIFLKSP